MQETLSISFNSHNEIQLGIVWSTSALRLLIRDAIIRAPVIEAGPV